MCLLPSQCSISSCLYLDWWRPCSSQWRRKDHRWSRGSNPRQPLGWRAKPRPGSRRRCRCRRYGRDGSTTTRSRSGCRWCCSSWRTGCWCWWSWWYVPAQRWARSSTPGSVAARKSRWISTLFATATLPAADTSVVGYHVHQPLVSQHSVPHLARYSSSIF